MPQLPVADTWVGGRGKWPCIGRAEDDGVIAHGLCCRCAYLGGTYLPTYLGMLTYLACLPGYACISRPRPIQVSANDLALQRCPVASSSTACYRNPNQHSDLHNTCSTLRHRTVPETTSARQPRDKAHSPQTRHWLLFGHKQGWASMRQTAPPPLAFP